MRCGRIDCAPKLHFCDCIYAYPCIICIYIFVFWCYCLFVSLCGLEYLFNFFFRIITIQATRYMFFDDKNFSFRCQLSDFSTDSIGMFTAYLCYSYFILKLADYADTMFFILRKKADHVSFLHVYHHVAVSVAAYICVLFATGSIKFIELDFFFYFVFSRRHQFSIRFILFFSYILFI